MCLHARQPFPLQGPRGSSLNDDDEREADLRRNLAAWVQRVRADLGDVSMRRLSREAGVANPTVVATVNERSDVRPFLFIANVASIWPYGDEMDALAEIFGLSRGPLHRDSADLTQALTATRERLAAMRHELEVLDERFTTIERSLEAQTTVMEQRAQRDQELLHALKGASTLPEGPLADRLRRLQERLDGHTGAQDTTKPPAKSHDVP